MTIFRRSVRAGCSIQCAIKLFNKTFALSPEERENYRLLFGKSNAKTARKGLRALPSAREYARPTKMIRIPEFVLIRGIRVSKSVFHLWKSVAKLISQNERDSKSLRTAGG